METKSNAPHFNQEMPYEIQLIFQDGGLHKLLRGNFKVDL